MTSTELVREFLAQAEACQGLADTLPPGSHDRAVAVAREATWRQAAARLSRLE